MAKEHGGPFQRPALLSGGDQHGSRLSVSCCNMHPSDAIDTASLEYPNSASMSLVGQTEKWGRIRRESALPA